MGQGEEFLVARVCSCVPSWAVVCPFSCVILTLAACWWGSVLNPFPHWLERDNLIPAISRDCLSFVKKLLPRQRVTDNTK